MALLFAVAFSIGSAPFCVVTNFGKECIYFDVQTCTQEADKQGGMCVLNPNK